MIPRSIGPPCKCKNRCRDNLLGLETDIFDSFWDLGFYHKQNVQLASKIQFHKPVTRRRVDVVDVRSSSVKKNF